MVSSLWSILIIFGWYCMVYTDYLWLIMYGLYCLSLVENVWLSMVSTGWVSQNQVYLMYTILQGIQRTNNNKDFFVYGCETTFWRDFEKNPYLICFLFHNILCWAVFLFTGQKRITFYCWQFKTFSKVIKMKNHILHLIL